MTQMTHQQVECGLFHAYNLCRELSIFGESKSSEEFQGIAKHVLHFMYLYLEDAHYFFAGLDKEKIARLYLEIEAKAVEP